MSKASSSHGLLTEYLRTSSRSIHRTSDSLVNTRVLVLFTNKKLYAQALSRFWHIFNTLEEELKANLEETELSGVKHILPKLFRAKAIETDLQYYLGDDWRSQVPPSPAVQEYCVYLKALAKRKPLLLLGHSYAQHMAIASGGQIIARMARQLMSLPESSGTAVYTYPEGMTHNSLKHEFKTALDNMGRKMPAELVEEIAQEHIQAFKHNNHVIRTFHMGWLNFFRGLLLLLPPASRLSLVLVLVALALWWNLSRLRAAGSSSSSS